MMDRSNKHRRFAEAAFAVLAVVCASAQTYDEVVVPKELSSVSQVFPDLKFLLLSPISRSFF